MSDRDALARLREDDRAILETEDWALEHFPDDSPHMTRRRNNAWAVCQALRAALALIDAELTPRRTPSDERTKPR